MSQGSKRQPYPYSLRSVAMGGITTYSVCNQGAFFYVVPPRNALTIENLFTHLVFLFDAAIPAANQKLVSIGITESQSNIPVTTGYNRRIILNQAADVNGRIDLSIDLSHLLRKTNVGYKDAGNGFGSTTGFTLIEFMLGASAATTGVIELWKTDALFTTTGIR